MKQDYQEKCHKSEYQYTEYLGYKLLTLFMTIFLVGVGISYTHELSFRVRQNVVSGVG